MSRLTEALDLLTPGRVLEGLAAYLGKPAPRLTGTPTKGTLCDFRPGLEEERDSLSYDVGKGGPVFNRFGVEESGGGAVNFLTSAGIPKPEAVRLLIEWAGLEDEKPARFGQKEAKGKARKGGQARRGAQKPVQGAAKEDGGKDPQKRTPKHVGLSAALEKLAQFAPLTPEDLAYRLRGLRPLEDPADGSEAAAEVTRRGLWPAVTAGVLRAYGLEDRAKLPPHAQKGALFFEVRGPDGEVWAVKFRNTDAGLEIGRAQTGKSGTRYAYVFSPHAKAGRPAWCARPMREDLPTLLIEGELNAAAVWVMLEAAGFGDAYNVQGLASVGALPHISHLRAGSAVYVFADMGDKRGEGDSAREVWGTLCAHAGAAVFQLGQTRTGEANPFAYQDALGAWQTGADACEVLGYLPPFASPESHARYMGEKLLKALEDAKPYTPAPEALEGGEEKASASGVLWVSDVEGFAVQAGKLYGVKKRWADGEEFEDFEELFNCAAYIAAEVTEDDGTGEGAKVFEIEGTRADGRPLPRLLIPSGEFTGMGWPAAKWGASAIVRSGNGKKDRAREGIQRLSEARGIAERTVYQFTGWKRDPVHGPVYLSAGASIGARGAVEGLEVDLSAGDGRLTGYALPDPAKEKPEDVREAVRQSLALLDLVGLDPVSVPVLGAVYRAPVGRADFVVWLTGETGRNKTAFLALAQAHYGKAWHAKHLPEGWNSSANSLEKSAHTVKDALFLIDDFKPGGVSSEVAQMNGKAGRIFQGAADGAGRSTLTADRKSRAGLYPRGLVMSSGESLPRGHSNRARAVIVDVTRKLIPDGDRAKSDAFYDAADRAKEGVYALALAAYVQGIAGNFEALRVGSEGYNAHVRKWARAFEGAHGRTGHALAELSYGWACFLAFAVSIEAITEGEALALWGRVVEALAYTSEGQAEHLHSEDPVGRALSLTASLLSQGRVYLADLKSGEAPGPDPDTARVCGWQARPTYGDSEDGEGKDGAVLTLRPGAVKVGYYSKAGGDEWAHFDPEALHEQLQRAAQGQAGAALPDKGALWANMRDRLHPVGLMRCQVEGQRVRTSWKVSTPEGLRRQLLTLRFPFDLPAYESLGTVGTMGTDGKEKTYDTAFLPVPITLFFHNPLGTVGTDKTVLSSPEARPAAAPLEDPADLEALEDWGEV